jgi:3-hydroxybutyryl-CoA dehydrogenase
MGCVIASVYARHGYHLALHDKLPSMAQSFRRSGQPIVESLSKAEWPIDAIFDNVAIQKTPEDAVGGAFLVHEIVQEDLGIKQELFSLLDQTCKPDVVLATNTSSYLLTDVCRSVQRRERVLVFILLRRLMSSALWS